MEFSSFLLALLGNGIIALGIIIIVFVGSKFKKTLLKFLDYITATTVGILLGIILLGFVPKLTTDANLVGTELTIPILVGIFIFYLLEVFLHRHHCKDLNNEEKSHDHSGHQHGVLMFGGTFLHNFFHGIVLFSAFSVNTAFGFATTIAILLHAIPQNLVNYIMNHNSPKYAYIAAFGGIAGALAIFPFHDFLLVNKFLILAIISGGLLYTALADILPEIKKKGEIKHKIIFVFCVLLGLVLFMGFEHLAHH